MIVAGIIAEYNPFHRGHEYHIMKTREKGATHIAVVMSGNFTQRGDIAVFDKSLRAEAALRNGADLVIELPVPYSLATAQKFGEAGIQILNSLGVVDFLSFGSECGKIEDIQLAVKAVSDNYVNEIIRDKLKIGFSFASARSEAVKEVYGTNVADVISSPNDTLGVEYVAALKRNASSIVPVAVERMGAGHDGDKAENGFASASYIREKIFNGKLTDIQPFLTHASYSLIKNSVESGKGPADIKKLEISLLSHLRRSSVEDIAKLPDVNEGLENRIYNAIRSACSLEELLYGIKTKRYAMSRIRRIVWSSYIGIDRAVANQDVPYLRILGMNERGIEILRSVKKTSRLPIVMRSRDVLSLNKTAQKVFDLECMATDLFSLSVPLPDECGMEQRRNIVIV